MLLMIDNYDSFTYNVVQYLGELGADPVVIRNDERTVEGALELEPDAVLLSPAEIKVAAREIATRIKAATYQ